jgi:hypothetical protein
MDDAAQFETQSNVHGFDLQRFNVIFQYIVEVFSKSIDSVEACAAW